ncbi:MAG TPA: methionyl-tRNA formyltransferase [Candidatus Macondimonas sp.]|nr:methionyl-tRNA formyltransferase [Candidatus Macondimonas sp.]
MRIVFAGTPQFAVPALKALLASGHDLVGVYTQPDRPAGRGRHLQASPVKMLAREHGLAVFQPETLRDPAAQATLAALSPDLMVVIAYGLLLPQTVLDLPRLGCVNLHASLLPRWRGAAPIQRAILAGDTDTGITLMQMEAGLDTGAMLMRRACPIDPHETAGELHDRLARLAAEVITQALPALAEARLIPEPQPAAGVTYAAKLDKAEAWIDWHQSALVIDRQIRAFNPWPVAQTRFGDQVLRIWRARPEPDSPQTAAPGTVVQADREGVAVATGEGCLWLEQAQLPGGRPLPAVELARGRALQGVCLGR